MKSNNNDDDEMDWRELFKNKMYKCYEMALKKNEPVGFTFRGVETIIHPDQQPVDDNLIEIRMHDVLEEAKKMSKVSGFHFTFIWISIKVDSFP